MATDWLGAYYGGGGVGINFGRVGRETYGKNWVGSYGHSGGGKGGMRKENRKDMLIGKKKGVTNAGVMGESGSRVLPHSISHTRHMNVFCLPSGLMHAEKHAMEALYTGTAGRAQRSAR